MKNFIFLFCAIIFETIATSALNASNQFSKFWPSVITVVGYVISFYFLSLSLKHIPVGIAYAIWSGVGIVLITLVGAIIFKQVPDLPAFIGLAFIICGVIIINVFSNTTTH